MIVLAALVRSSSVRSRPAIHSACLIISGVTVAGAGLRSQGAAKGDGADAEAPRPARARLLTST